MKRLAAVALIITLAGCAATSGDAQRASLAALATPTAPPTATPTPTPTADCGDRTASLRPSSRAGSFVDQIRRRGRLIAGVDQNTLRFAYLQPDSGRIEGFEIDLLHEVARAIFGDPTKVELRAITTSQRASFLRSGAVDIVADAFTITCARRRLVTFSTVYYEDAQRLLVPSRSHARDVADLRGRRVCATVGSTSLARISADPAHVIPYPVGQRTDCLVDLQQGVVDAITSDDSILLGFRLQDPKTKRIGPPLEREPYGMAIAKSHPDFVRFVNAVLERVRRDGTWQRIHQRWLGDLLPSVSPPTPRYQ